MEGPEYQGFDADTDFDTKRVVKHNAPELVFPEKLFSRS